MSQVRFSPRSIFIGLALIAILGIALTLVVVAQETDADGEPSRSPDRIAADSGSDPLPDPAAPDAISYFLFLSANTFVPNTDDMTYNYGGGGCVYRTGGASWMDHSVELPQGAQISQVRLYFLDDEDDYEAGVWLHAFPGNGDSETLVEMETTGNPGQTYLDSPPFSHTVDNSAEALSVRLGFQGSTSSSLQICGVRIRYQYSPSITSLPLILNAAGP